jgi:hypothetical protein
MNRSVILICTETWLKTFQRGNLKGKVSRDFLLQVFFMNQFPQAAESNIRVILNFSKIHGYSQVKVHPVPPVTLVLLTPVSVNNTSVTGGTGCTLL